MIRRFLLLSILIHAAALTALYAPAARRALVPDGIPAQLAGAADPAPAASAPARAAVASPIASPAPSGGLDEAPARPAATAAAGEHGRDALANHLQVRLRGLMAEHFRYPPLARRNGWEGRVELLLALDGDGGIRALRIARSSGHSILDEDALDTVRRIGSRPQTRAELAGCACELRLPVLYRLIEG